MIYWMVKVNYLSLMILYGFLGVGKIIIVIVIVKIINMVFC